MLVDGSRGKDGILPDIGMTVLETGSRGGEEGFYELGLAELGQEAEGVAANVLIRVLEVIPDAVAGSHQHMSSRWSIGTKKGGAENGSTHQTRIISCLSFPLESCFGHIS